MTPFTNQLAHDSVKQLAQLANTFNNTGYQAGQCEAYGGCYNAIQSILVEQFGEVVAEDAMNSRTWCVSDFENQIIPAIIEAIEEDRLERWNVGCND